MLTISEAVDEAKKLQSKYGFAFDMQIIAERLGPNPLPDRRAKVLTDDRAPVNWLRKQQRKTSPEPTP